MSDEYFYGVSGCNNAISWSCINDEYHSQQKLINIIAILTEELVECAKNPNSFSDYPLKDISEAIYVYSKVLSDVGEDGATISYC
jgi:hypothetical protein